MEKFRRTAILLLSWFILCSLILCSIGDGEGQKGDDQESKTLAGTLNSVLSRATTSTKSNWGKAKAWIHEVQLRFFLPNLDFRTGEAKSNGAGEKVKDAVEKSFGTSKSAVEDTAKSAGKAVGEAVHKTTEKVKKKVYDDTSGRSHEDL